MRDDRVRIFFRLRTESLHVFRFFFIVLYVYVARIQRRKSKVCLIVQYFFRNFVVDHRFRFVEEERTLKERNDLFPLRVTIFFAAVSRSWAIRTKEAKCFELYQDESLRWLRKPNWEANVSFARMPAAARNFEQIDRSTIDEMDMWQPRAIVCPFVPSRSHLFVSLMTIGNRLLLWLSSSLKRSAFKRKPVKGNRDERRKEEDARVAYFNR